MVAVYIERGTEETGSLRGQSLSQPGKLSAQDHQSQCDRQSASTNYSERLNIIAAVAVAVELSNPVAVVIEWSDLVDTE